MRSNLTWCRQNALTMHYNHTCVCPLTGQIIQDPFDNKQFEEIIQENLPGSEVLALSKAFNFFTRCISFARSLFLSLEGNNFSYMSEEN